MAEENHPGYAGLRAGKIYRCLHIERCFLPPDRCLIVLEPSVEAECQKATRGQLAATEMV